MFKAIRRLIFPEATVSQTSSYCLTAGLWCRAETLSPPPPLFLLLLLLCFASLLCWFSELLFLSENLYKATAWKETRERDWEGKSSTQRQSGAGEENCDSSEAVIDATCACLQCTLQANRRALLIVSIKKVGSQPSVFLCISFSLNKDKNAKHQAYAYFWKTTSCYAETTKDTFVCATGTSLAW